MPLPRPDPDRYVDLGNLLARGGVALDSYLDMLMPHQRATVERAVTRRTAQGWRGSPSAMAEHLTRGEWQRYPYADLLARKFTEAFQGSDPHQIWNLPSQYGKTSALVWGIVWALDFNPKLRIMYVSYDADKAVEEGGRARDLAEEHAAHLRFRLRTDRRARALWRTTQGGGLYCTGINGAITGFPADALLLDDLIKGWQAAHSETQRQFVMNVYRSQIRMRIQSGVQPIIAAGTRWHQEDVSGQLVTDQETNPDADRWTIIRLPAIAEPADPANADPLLRLADPLGRKPGEPLEARRFALTEVRARQAVLGSYLWAAMEQQRPAPEEGGEIKRGWWQWATEPPPRFDDALTSWDMKLKDKTGGDFVAGQAWGRTGADYWWLDGLRGQFNLVETKTAIVLMAVRHPDIRRHVIENTGNGPEVMQELRRAQPRYEVSPEVRSKLGITDDELPAVEGIFRRGLGGLVPENVKYDKRTRVRAQSPLIEGGNVHLLLNRPAADHLVNEAAAFPNGAHDDDVDSMSQALRRLSTSPASATAPTGVLTMPRPSRARTATARIGRPMPRRSPGRAVGR